MKAALQSPFSLRGALTRGCLCLSILFGLVLTTTSGSPVSAAAATYTGLVPARLLDTRLGSTTNDGQFAGVGPIGTGSVLNLTIGGRGGVPGSGVGAVAINVTIASATASSFLTVYPSGSPRPTASNLNFASGQTVANMVIVPIGANGQISLYNYSGQSEVLVDVLGWFSVGAGYTGFAPSRLLDTRSSGGPVGPNSVFNLPLLGRSGIPSSGVGAVVVNVTSTSPTMGSFLTVYPAGSPRPTASNLNFGPGQTIANMVIVPVGTNGQISFFNSAGYAHVLVDVLGYFADDADYSGFSSARLMDTRTGGSTVDGQFAGTGQSGPASVVNLTVLGRGGVPGSGVGAVAINVTATQPCAASFVTVYPGGAARPNASNLNFSNGQTVANLVIVPVGTDGKISLYNNAGQADLLVDVLGWFEGTPIAGSAATSAASSGCPGTIATEASECTALTNQARAAAGVAPLSISITVNAAAQAHSQYQAANKTMTHTGANGTSAGTRITAAGYAWGAWGENVAFGQADCASVVAAWMNSPGHRANMLNPVFKHIGIGMAVASNGAKYWTMKLAAPL